MKVLNMLLKIICIPIFVFLFAISYFLTFVISVGEIVISLLIFLMAIGFIICAYNYFFVGNTDMLFGMFGTGGIGVAFSLVLFLGEMIPGAIALIAENLKEFIFD